MVLQRIPRKLELDQKKSWLRHRHTWQPDAWTPWSSTPYPVSLSIIDDPQAFVSNSPRLKWSGSSIDLLKGDHNGHKVGLQNAQLSSSWVQTQRSRGGASNSLSSFEK